MAKRSRRPCGGGRSCTIGRDVRTDGAALGAACHQCPAFRRAFGLHRGIRPRRLAPRDTRGGRRRALHGAHHVQGDGPLPVDAGNLRGDRGRRWLVQRGDRPRIDGLLGPGPATRGDAGDGRAGRADRPADPRRRRDRGRARRHRGGDPLVPRRPRGIRPDPLPAGDVRGRAARPRDLRRRGGHPRPPGGDDPRLLADPLPTGQHRRRPGRRPGARAGRRSRRDRLRDGQRQGPGLHGGADTPRRRAVPLRGAARGHCRS